MRNDRSNRSARVNRRKAIFLTVLFHIVLIGGLTIGTNGELIDLVPDFVLEWFNPPVEVVDKA